MHLQEMNVSEFQNYFFCYSRDVVSFQIAVKKIRLWIEQLWRT